MLTAMMTGGALGCTEEALDVEGPAMVCCLVDEHLNDPLDCGCEGPCDEGHACEEGVCVQVEEECLPEEHLSDPLNCACEGLCAGGHACIDGQCVAALEAPRQECDDDACVASAVLVPSGLFLIGHEREVRGREVMLTRPYAIQATEVTQRQYEDLMGENPSHFGPEGGADECGPDCPVESVTWLDAVAYCNALSVHQGLKPCLDVEGNVIDGETVYECEGWRLPTAAEWEKAARGVNGWSYPWGHQEDPTCSRVVMNDVHSGCGQGSPWPVGSRPRGASPYGLQDMAGNVSEWTVDFYVDRIGDSVDPVETMVSSERVVRGGSWDLQDVDYFHTAVPNPTSPDQAYADVGFRCVRSR